MKNSVEGSSRILVIGPCGAGKSTLSRKIGTALGIPVIHMDALFWLPGWVEEDETRFRTKLTAALEQERWIVDGNYSRTLVERIGRADLVLFLDLPRRIYFRRILYRVARFWGRQRPDMGNGCRERLDFGFLKFVWTLKSRTEKTRQILRDNQERSNIVWLKSASQVREFEKANKL